MHYSTRDILGEVAYLKRNCELLTKRLEGIENMLFGTERLTPMQEGMVADANARWAAGAKDHLDLAIQYVDGWNDAITAALCAKE